MAIPEEIRRVARPKNTVVVQSGSKGANLYAVRERAGFKYGPKGNPQPINGRIIGHIVDGRYVPLHDDLIRCHTTFRHPFNLSWSGKTCDIRRSSKTTS